MNVLIPGDRFAGYVVDAPLGRGGHAGVYRARHAGGHGVVALKVLDDDHRQPAQMARLRREFAFARRVRHPHVVAMYDAGPAWLAMQLVDGGVVSSLTTVQDRLAALAQIADALDFTHRQGIVHADVKPSNILVTANFPGRGAVLVDFGEAYAVADAVGRHPEHVEASLPYSAPELLRGQAPSAATDEYALACTAVELITGTPPFSADTPAELIDQHLNRQPPAVSHRIDGLPRVIDTILARAIAKNPDSRYGSCTEFVARIARALR